MGTNLALRCPSIAVEQKATSLAQSTAHPATCSARHRAVHESETATLRTWIILVICSFLFCGLSLSDSNSLQRIAKFGDGLVLTSPSGRSSTSEETCAAASRVRKLWENCDIV